MKKRIGFLVITLLFATTMTNNFVFASVDKESLESITKQSKEISKTVLLLVENGKEDDVNNLPEVKKFKEKLDENPKLAEQYFSNLDAVEAIKNGTYEYNLGTNDSEIIKFDDGSFIKISANTTITNTPTNQENKINSLIEPFSIQYDATDDFKYEIWGVYKVAECHLLTDYHFGFGVVEITDVSVTARVNLPAWLVSKDAFRVSDTKSKGDFVMQDIMGTFNLLLITELTATVDSVKIKHTSYY